MSGRLSNSIWGSDVLLFSEFINIVSTLHYIFTLHYTFHFIVIYASFSKFKVFIFHENLRINDEVFINKIFAENDEVFINKIFADLWFDSGNK